MIFLNESHKICKDEFVYRVETHLHTSQGSACGHNTGAEMARAYKQDGYCAIIVTDHFFNGNTAVRGNYTWDEKIALFMRGYDDAKLEGNKIGIDVYFGFEYNYHGTEFLIYNLNREWLLSYPQIITEKAEAVLKKVRNDGGFAVHDHPFRVAPYIPYPGRVLPSYTDGVEVINKGNADEKFNELAYEYARKYDLVCFAGSDIHTSSELRHGGMAFRKKPQSIGDIIEMARTKECILL